MNYDEFAFFNRQLAEMLRTGVPLEGALRQLTAGMRDAPLRDELRLVETELARGRPLREALAQRELPEFYTRMIRLGAASEELPAMLTMLADYYERRHALWTRLKALIVYPAMVLAAALALSLFLIWLNTRLVNPAMAALQGSSLPTAVPVLLWLPPVWLAAAAVLLALALSIRAWRDQLNWRLPGFKESSLAQFAAAMHLLLRRGGNLADSVALVRDLEAGSPAGRELAEWHARIASGEGRFAEFSSGSRVFPPLFLWLVGQGGEDLSLGFRRAAEIYFQRARQRAEMLLYAALPVGVITLGVLILLQVSSGMVVIVNFLNALGAAE